MIVLATNRQRDGKVFTSSVRLNAEVEWLVGDAGKPYRSEMPRTAVTKIVNALISEADASTTSEDDGVVLLLFVHGFNETYDAARKRVEALDAALRKRPDGFRGVIVGFCWPSAGKITAYWGDSAIKAPESARALVGLINTLDQVRVEIGSQAPLRLAVMAHSMGNHVLTTAFGLPLQVAPRNWPSPLFDQALLVAADVDATTLLPGEPGNATLRSCGRVTVYRSVHDSALRFSEKFVHHRHRLGFSGPSRLEVLPPHFTTQERERYQDGVIDLDCSEFARGKPPRLDGPGGHSAYFKVPELLADISATLMLTGDRTTIPGREAVVAGDRQRFVLHGRSKPGPAGEAAPGDEPKAETAIA